MESSLVRLESRIALLCCLRGIDKSNCDPTVPICSQRTGTIGLTIGLEQREQQSPFRQKHLWQVFLSRSSLFKADAHADSSSYSSRTYIGRFPEIVKRGLGNWQSHLRHHIRHQTWIEDATSYCLSNSHGGFLRAVYTCENCC